MNFPAIKTILATKADLGNYLYVEGRGVCKVVNRESKRGRGGYTKIRLLFGDKSLITVSTAVYSSIVDMRVASEQEIKEFQRKYEFSEFGRKTEAPPPPPPPPRERLHIVYQGSLTISVDQMTFFKLAELPQFPCTLAELRKGYARVCHVVHPDKTEGAGSERAFASMHEVYESLKGYCKG